MGALLGVAVMGGAVRSAIGEEATPPAGNPFPGSSAAEGQRLFKQFGGPCHGFDARGGQGPDLTDETWAHGGSDIEIYRTIAAGVPGTRMREFGSLLTGEELWKIIAYLRSVASAPAR